MGWTIAGLAALKLYVLNNKVRFDMELYMFSIDYQASRRPKFYTTYGVVSAETADEAREIIWANLGSDYAYNIVIQHVDSSFMTF